jgi:hypothetical protein
MKTPEPVLLYQRRGFSTVLNDAFYFFSQNFFPLSKLILFYAGPVILIESLFLALFQMEFMNPLDFYAMATYLGLYGLFVFLSTAIILCITCHYLSLYHSNGNHPLTKIKDVMQVAGKDIVRIFFALLGVTIIIMFSALFFIIPALYLMIPSSLLWIIMIEEKRGFFSAFNRSLSLIRNYWWRTLGLLFISGLIQGAIGFFLQMPTHIIGFLHGFHQTESGTTQIPEYLVLAGFYLSGLSQFFMIITALITAFQYYSIVEQKEAPDLLDRIDAINADGGEVA